MQENIQTAGLIEEYVQDVINRNERMIAYRDDLFEQYKSMPLDEIKSQLKKVMGEDWAYRGFGDDERNSGNDFALLEKEAPIAVVQRYLHDNYEVKKLLDIFLEQRSSVQNCTTLCEDDKKKQISNLRKIANLKFEYLYRVNLPEIKAKGYEKEYYAKVLSGKEAEFENRRAVQQEFNLGKSDDEIMVFDEELDKGCCTKSLTVSLYKLQEKYGLDIFGKPDNVEDVAHPIPLTEKLKKYVKTAESGNLEDIKIKRGDIVFLTTPDGTPIHAMLCYDFDKDTKEPLLIGFSSLDKGVKAYKNEDNKTRRGIVLDVNSLIRDAHRQSDKSNFVQPQYKTRD